MIVQYERPFLFSGPLVLAILAGTKTQTRRFLLGSEDIVDQSGDVWEQSVGRACGIGRAADRGRWILIRDGAVIFASRPTLIPGDGMWVKETWRAGANYDGMRPAQIVPGAPVVYEADRPGSAVWRSHGRIRQSIFMPRWASRITRKVVAVRVERLQDITEAQARAEGVEPPEGDAACWLGASSRGAFAKLWDRINGKVPAKRWATNPLVVATTFEGP